MVNYLLGDKRFYTLLVVLFVMWLGVMGLFYLKADEVTHNPCELCAERLDREIFCTIAGGGSINNQIFYPNLTTVVH